MATNHTAMSACQARPASRRYARLQRGVYAVEWAIIFPVFFALLYAIISYGLTFLVRESMQYAVEEGARAALRYPSSSVQAAAPSSPPWEHRRTQAQNATANALAWLPANLRPAPADIRFNVCHLGTANCSSSSFNPNIVCNTATPCMVVVGYGVADYRSHAIAPALPGLGLVLPASLQANASIMVDRGVL
ncbi:TadE/TadG family type IV pilus assembly protein [Lampropedia aestuarii]|nr:TadE/TadG family type IV pilus assembly protein [Lampropedia aestuarii]